MNQQWYCPVCERIFRSSRTFLSHTKTARNKQCKRFYADNPSAQPSGPYNPNQEERDTQALSPPPQTEETLPPTGSTNKAASSVTTTPNRETLGNEEAVSPTFSLNETAYADFAPDDASVAPNETNVGPNHDAALPAQDAALPAQDQATQDGANNNLRDFERIWAQYLGNYDPVDEVLGNGNTFASTKGHETTIREKFIRYEHRARQHNEHMQQKHKCALQLMSILDKEGVSLSLYNQLMDWHVDNSTCANCGRNTQVKVKDKDLYKHLQQRHGMEDLTPYPVRTYLPHAKMHIDVPCHDAPAMLRDMLSDPRIKDDDYLFFDNDPLQGPPPSHEWDELADINTGLAYRETYDRIIRPNPKTKCGTRHKVLLPVLIYMDGCVTGQFQNLSLELVKFTCGIFTAEARDRGHLWRNLGAMPKVRESKAKATDILGKSSNADARNYVSHDKLEKGLPNNQPEGVNTGPYGGVMGNDSPNSGNQRNFSLNEAVSGKFGLNVGTTINQRNAISQNGGNGANDSLNEPNNTQKEGSRRSKQSQSTRWSPPFECDDYTPELLHTLEEAENAPEMPDTNAQDFHCMLHTVLASYKEMQDKEGIEWDLWFEGRLWYLLLIPYIVLVKGDGVEQEKHCAKYGSRNGKVKCLCRHCCCPTEETDQPFARYALKTKPMMVKLIREQDMDGLRVISQKYVWNAWYELRFGLHNNRSIHGASPMEMLHWIQLGQYKYTRTMIFEQTGEGQMGEDLNDYCCALGPMFQRQSDKSFPRCNFTNTIMKGILMAHEMTGVILLLLVAMRSTKGRHIMVDCARTTKQKNHFRYISDWIHLLELQLEMISWLKSPSMKVGDVEKFRVKCREYMLLYKLVGNRAGGMQFKTMNFHGMLHVADDIINFGVPNNVDTKSDEHHHRDDKKATKRTQHRPDNFDIQSLQRIVDRRAVQYGIAELGGAKRWEYSMGMKRNNQRKRPPVDDSFGLNNTNQPDKIRQNEASVGQSGVLGDIMRQYQAIMDGSTQNEPTVVSFSPTKDTSSLNGEEPDNFSVRGVKADFAWCEKENDFVMTTKSRMKNKHKYQYEPSVKATINTICFECEEYLDTVSTYSEIVMENGQTYRASPSHLGKPWYDWARNGHRLFHIKCFVDLTGLPTINSTRYNSKVYMITEPAGVVTNDEDRYFPCDLVEAWSKSPDVEFPDLRNLNHILTQPVANITGPACVIADIDNPNHRAFLRVRPPSDWGELFLQWLRAEKITPHSGNSLPDEASID